MTTRQRPMLVVGIAESLQDDAQGQGFIPAPALLPVLAELRDQGFGVLLLACAETPSELASVAQASRYLAAQEVPPTEVLICRHSASADCLCKPPHLGLLRPWLTGQTGTRLDPVRSAVVGRGERFRDLATNLGISWQSLTPDGSPGSPAPWRQLASALKSGLRRGHVVRRTAETAVDVMVDLGRPHGGQVLVQSGIGYFDHMLDQIARHAGFELRVKVSGDLEVDEHHTVEDTALALGQALAEALGERRGIGRYGFVLPMDEALASAALDLSGRPWLEFTGAFPRDRVGELPTELVPHFFQSLTQTLGATLHLEVKGDNAHHMVEALFKAFGRALGQAVAPGGGTQIPSTKGTLG